jgi:uncharacterized protein with GYD domain
MVDVPLRLHRPHAPETLFLPSDEEAVMPKYLFQASYTAQGVAGIRQGGGSSRVDAITATVEGVGGRVESVYFSFGDDDLIAVFDLPNNEAATAISLTVNATGAVSVKTTVLITPEELDAAARLSVDYRPPGS